MTKTEPKPKREFCLNCGAKIPEGSPKRNYCCYKCLYDFNKKKRDNQHDIAGGRVPPSS